MTTIEQRKTPWHLWAVGVFAILFNAIGVFDFVMSMRRAPSTRPARA